MSEKNSIQSKAVYRFRHRPEQVFDAWLDEKRAAQFLFVSEAGEIVRCEMDARVGGEFVITARRAEGDVEHRGEYLEIDRPRKLVFRFGIPADSADRDRVSIDIRPDGDGCELTLLSENGPEMSPEWMDYLERANAAWRRMLRSLEAALG